MGNALIGRKAIVTGGSGDIGRAIAMDFASEGASVILTYSRDKSAAECAARDVKTQASDQVHIRQCDVRCSEDVQATVAFASDAWGSIDLLVNNAGVMQPCDALQFDPNEMIEAIRVNVIGPALFVRAVVPYMVKSGYGRIINISSTVGFVGSCSSVTYGASKAALNSMTSSHATALAKDGITVNAIAPSTIRGRMFGSLAQSRREDVVNATPSARSGWPQEVASVATFLASERAGFINGQVIVVDGGRLRWVPGIGNAG